MGRLLEGRGSQKTCLSIKALPPRTGCNLKILRIKKGNPRIDLFGPGIFFVPRAYLRTNKRRINK